MNALLALPLNVRLAGLAAIGLIVGAAVNWAIYSLAWHPRPISPWQRPDPKAPKRESLDRLPVIGWLGLAREAPLHGRGFWVRPLLLELVCGVGLPWLYWWEVSEHLAPPVGLIKASDIMLHSQFLAHAILIVLMLVATFIDFDEQTIPDSITIPGTLIGLLLIGLLPDALLPVIRTFGPNAATGYAPLLLTSTSVWPAWLDGWYGLLLGAGIFSAWCVILIPALATLRRGWRKGIQFYFASMLREHAWWQMLILAALGGGYIAWIWHRGGPAWQSLLTSLVGLAGGGLTVWGVRIAGWLGLRKEAMGFGDVTLMAMIGTYLGWQACLVVFFLSPAAALFIALAQWVLTGRRDIAFGPYLALAALFVILYWPHVWSAVALNFAAGWLVPAFFAAGLLLMTGLLMLWRITEQAFFAKAAE